MDHAEKRMGHIMNARRVCSILATVLATACAAGTPSQAQTVSTRAASASAPPILGQTKAAPESDQLARRVGTWTVVMTMRPTATATPIVVAGLTAERSLTGPYLQEIMRPASGSTVPEFRRIDFLTYNRLQARWQYLSMDTRATVGLMFAQGFGPDRSNEVTVYFNDFPAPTELGPEVAGHFMRARHVLTRVSEDHEFSRQYWSMEGRSEWLGVQYEYTRAGRTR
jgi:hypothetical protein